MTSLLLPDASIPPMPIPPRTYFHTLQTAPNLTLFAPSNIAWSKLAPIERTYLESGFATDDIDLLVKLHASGSGVGWRESFERKREGEIELAGGGKLWVELDEAGEMTVGLERQDRDGSEEEEEEDNGLGRKNQREGVRVVQADNYAENGTPCLSSELRGSPSQPWPHRLINSNPLSTQVLSTSSTSS